MRNLIAFFQRFRIFLVFLTLQLIALGSYFSLVSYPRTQFFNTSNRVVASFLELERDITKHLYLDEANQLLQKENIALRSKQSNAFLPSDTMVNVVDSMRKVAYRYMPATVINSTHTHKNNYFTIKLGSSQGVEPKMGVISPAGIVGVVYDVSANYAIVKSILTENFNLSAKIKRNNAHGILKYRHLNPLFVSLTGISNDIKLVEGDTILARGSGGYFPEDTPIGTIDRFETVEGKPLWDISVKLFQDMRRLHYVYVIEHIQRIELQALESQIENYQP
jgi:rod shape-determining protein MreC